MGAEPTGEISYVRARMPSENLTSASATSPKVKRRWAMVVALFFLTLSVYTFTANGHVQTADYAEELGVATELAAGHGFSLPGIPVRGGGIQPGREGKSYAPHDLGTSLILYPMAALLPGAHRGGLPTPRLFLISSFVDAVFAAGTVALFADLLIDLGLDLTSSMGAALLYAFATLIWPFSHISFDVVPTAIFVLMAIWAMARLTRPDDARELVPWAAISGLAMACAVVIRIDAGFIAVAFTVAMGWRAWQLRGRMFRAAGIVAAWLTPLV